MNKGICVQIGLADIAEYAYLAESNWKEQAYSKNIDSAGYIPKDLIDAYDTWEYYGIDLSPISVAYMLKQHPVLENRHWICMGVSDRFSFNRVVEFMHQKENIKFSALFFEIDALLEMLGLQNIDILVVDIEGGEHKLFNEDSIIYKKIRPKFINVEYHHSEYFKLTRSEFRNIIYVHQYQIISELEQSDGISRQATFLLKDIMRFK